MFHTKEVVVMVNKTDLIIKVSERDKLLMELNSLIYGSVEIRERTNKKFIYVHYREDGLSLTKYVGEYSDNLYNLILNNNIKAKDLKKKLKQINKELSSFGYVENNLPSNIALNIDFAKKHLVDLVFKQAVLEGIATTYADTETIIEGGKVNNLGVEDVLKVVNLKHAWEFILNKSVILSETNFQLLCEINKLVEDGFFYNAGKVRQTPVYIGGTNWKPELPIESVIREEIEEILNKKTNVINKAIELLLYVMKRQIFIDGNKRTAVIFANHLLIKNGCGLIIIPDDKVNEYKKLLIDFYEGKNTTKIKNFLKVHALKELK